jgi:hypothetical protein
VIYARLVFGALLAVAIFLGGYKVADWRGKAASEALQAANALALADDYKKLEAAHIAKETALAAENDQLKNDSLKFPTVSVRMCKYASPIVSTTGTPRQVIPTSAGVGSSDPKPVPQGDGPDYGPSLFGLADALDSIDAKCRAL